MPYRKDDLTASYRDSYVRFADEAGFAVCRLDLRGTGSSGGTATDEYPDAERADLRDVIGWLATQPWSSGRVGMFGTSYSGFNSLHMAAEGVPELGAVVAMYATDDRYTDDVHYHGGVLRAIDIIDYVLYMVPMNALPPVPALWGDGWEDEWRRRIDESPAWMLDWLREQADSPMWRRGSIRLGPGDQGYERLTCPTMLIAGWADGYRNNTFRTIERLRVPWRLLAGPWSHKDPARARPGPNIDADREIIAFFDEHLRAGPPSVDAPAQVFVRGSVRPEPDLALHDGVWRDLSEWPPPGLRWVEFAPVATDDRTDDLTDDLAVRGDVGVAAWISCAGGLPWGQPLDQRADDARSLTYDWPIDERAELLGNASVSLRIRSSAPVAHLAVRLCDVFPDGTSALITRGILNLSHVGCWPVDPDGDVGRAPSPVTPGAWIDATARARGDDVDVDARPHAASRHRRERLAELLAAARSAHAQRGSGVDRAPRPRRRRARRIDARVRAGRRTSERRGRRCGVEHLPRRARSRDPGADPIRRPLRRSARLVDRRRVRGRARRVDRRSGSGVGEGPRRVHDPLAGGDVLDRRHRRRRSRTPTRSTSSIELVATHDGEPFATREWRESFPRTF